MCSFPDTTGVTVVDEGTLENGLKDTDDGMVHKTVPHRRFVDHAMLWIENVKPMIRAVAITAAHKIVVKFKHMIFEVPLEFLNVPPIAFASAELAPCGE